MYVIVVYDTASERNPQILRTCRRYLHHVQRSVFEGRLSAAQLTRFQSEVKSLIHEEHDHVITYTLPAGAQPDRTAWGCRKAPPSDIL